MGYKVNSARKDKRVFKQTLKRVHKSNYLVPKGGVRK